MQDTIAPPPPTISKREARPDHERLTLAQKTDTFLDSPGYAGRSFSQGLSIGISVGTAPRSKTRSNVSVSTAFCSPLPPTYLRKTATMLRMMLRTTLLALVAVGFFLFSRPSDADAHKSSFTHFHAFSLPLGGTFHKLQQKGAFFQPPASVAAAFSATNGSSVYGTLVQAQTDFLPLAITLISIYAAVYLTSLIGNIWAAIVPHRAGRLAWGIVGIIVSTFFLVAGFVTISLAALLVYILPSTALLGLSISNVVLGARMPRPLPLSLLPFVTPDPLGRPVSGLLLSGSF